MTEDFEVERGSDSDGGRPTDRGRGRAPEQGRGEPERGDRGRPMAHPLGTSGRPVRTGRAETPRPLLERIGMAAIAAVLGLLFAGVAVAAYLGGELFLAVMAGIGSLMTLWAGALTLVRG
ncbi:MAG TPA: hypothetical protein VNO86_10870 [Candidatus Binatia bacterium]|nr:hypothetical protein [Candidatus Binatia bacterium]